MLKKIKFFLILRKIICVFLLLCFLFEQNGFAQGIYEINIGSFLFKTGKVPEHNTAEAELRLRYLFYDLLENNFKLLVEKKQLQQSDDNDDLESVTKKLFNYFLIGIVLPNDAFWVNLRPDSSENIMQVKTVCFFFPYRPKTM